MKFNIEVIYTTPFNKDTSSYLSTVDNSHIIALDDVLTNSKADIEKLYHNIIEYNKESIINIYLVCYGNIKLVDKFTNMLLSKNVNYNISKKLYFYKDLEDTLNDNHITYELYVSLITKYYKKFSHVLASYKINYFNQISDSINTKNNINCIIADMDSTICLNTIGRSYYDPKRMDLDMPNKPIITIINNHLICNPNDKLIIITGRDYSACKDVTIKYVKDTFPDFYNDNRIIVKFRDDDDKRSSSKYKESIIKTDIIPNYNIIFALDDDSSIIKAYRKLGITALQVNDF